MRQPLESGQGGAAVPHLVAAGREALAASAYREAREAFASALDQLGFAAEHDQGKAGAAREGLLLRANTGLGDAEAALGRYGRSGDAYMADARAANPQKRFIQPPEIGALCAWLCREEALGVTMQLPQDVGGGAILQLTTPFDDGLSAPHTTRGGEGT